MLSFVIFCLRLFFSVWHYALLSITKFIDKIPRTLAKNNFFSALVIPTHCAAALTLIVDRSKRIVKNSRKQTQSK
jgi:membrane protease YdiL (CAAX protease family)